MALRLPEQATPSTPATGYSALYPKAGGLWYFKDAAGVEHPLTPATIAFTAREFGLDTSNNVTDPTNDIDIAIGAITDDSNTVLMSLSSVLTKRIDASWVVGTNQGGLDGTESVAGTPDNDTWYYVWLIQRSDTGVVDALFSESSTTPTMPTNYNRKRLIGVVRRGTATNLKFYQDGDFVKWQSSIAVLTSGTATIDTAVTISSAVPPVAKSFSVSARVAGTIVAAQTGQNDCVVQVAASVDYATIATGYEHDGTAFTALGRGGSFEIPYTGVFNYRNATISLTGPTASIYVHGFKLAKWRG